MYWNFTQWFENFFDFQQVSIFVHSKDFTKDFTRNSCFLLKIQLRINNVRYQSYDALMQLARAQQFVSNQMGSYQIWFRNKYSVLTVLNIFWQYLIKQSLETSSTVTLLVFTHTTLTSYQICKILFYMTIIWYLESKKLLFTWLLRKFWQLWFPSGTIKALETKLSRYKSNNCHDFFAELAIFWVT